MGEGRVWGTEQLSCGGYHVTAVSLRHYERNRVNAFFVFVNVNIVNSHLIVIYLTTCLNEEQETKNAI
jgi:hypothetical protein